MKGSRKHGMDPPWSHSKSRPNDFVWWTSFCLLLICPGAAWHKKSRTVIITELLENGASDETICPVISMCRSFEMGSEDSFSGRRYHFSVRRTGNPLIVESK